MGQTSKATGYVMQAISVPLVVWGFFLTINAMLTQDPSDIMTAAIWFLPGMVLLIGGKRVVSRAEKPAART